MYIVFVILIIIASALIILAVLAQNPKSGMAANFGAGNQVMGARQTADFLEKFTWGLAIVIVTLSLAASVVMNAYRSTSNGNSDKLLEQFMGNRPAEIPVMPLDAAVNGDANAEQAADVVVDGADAGQATE